MTFSDPVGAHADVGVVQVVVGKILLDVILEVVFVVVVVGLLGLCQFATLVSQL